MKKTSLRATFNRFDKRLDTYDGLATTVSQAERVIRYKWQKTELLQAFVLRLVSQWDVFVANLMVDCLHRDSSKYSEYTGLSVRKHLAPGEAEGLLTGLGYLDFRSVGEVQKTARQILVVNPFRAISKGAAKKIDETQAMRNYLSHYSRRSKRALQAKYRANHRLKNFREPGDFLWADDRRSRRMRFFVYLDAFRDASSAMRKALKAQGA